MLWCWFGTQESLPVCVYNVAVYFCGHKLSQMKILLVLFLRLGKATIELLLQICFS